VGTQKYSIFPTHGLMGVGIVAPAILIPVKPVYRLTGLIIIDTFNFIRMRLNLFS